MESVATALNTALQEPPIASAVAPDEAPPRIRPGQRHFQCEVCRFMHDIGERAPGCHCNWIECTNRQCPASQTFGLDGQIVRLKSRFCHPTKCRFYEAASHD